MLPEMTRQVLQGVSQFEELANGGLAEIESRVAKVALQRIARVAIFPGAYQAGEPAQRFGVESQHFSGFASGRTPSISDHVRRHSRAALAEALVNVLNGLFPLIAGRQVKINVRP